MSDMININKLIRSSRRTLGLEITSEAKLIVRAPKAMPESSIQAFILEKKHWIERHQERVLERMLLKSQQQWPEHLDLKRWKNRYRYLAFTIIKSRCAYYAAINNLNYNQIKISNARRRWGSCSPNGNLNFNWRLILSPLFVIDYLIVHELAHLVVKNHSHRFWAKVEQMDPAYLKAEHWLKHNGYLLDI